MKIFQLIRGKVEPDYFRYWEDDEKPGWVKPAAVAGAVAFLLLAALLIAQFAGIDGGGLIDASRNPGAPADGLAATPATGVPGFAAQPNAVPDGIVLHPDLEIPFAQSRVSLAEAVTLSDWLNSRPAFMEDLPARFIEWALTNPNRDTLQSAFAGMDGSNLLACASSLGVLQILTVEETGALVRWLSDMPPLPPGVAGQKFALELETVQAQCAFLGL